MILIIENYNGQVRKFKDLSDQQCQAISDTEDYTIIRTQIVHIETEHKIHVEQFMEDGVWIAVTDGSFAQDGNVVQVI